LVGIHLGYARNVEVRDTAPEFQVQVGYAHRAVADDGNQQLAVDFLHGEFTAAVLLREESHDGFVDGFVGLQRVGEEGKAVFTVTGTRCVLQLSGRQLHDGTGQVRLDDV